MYVQRRRRGRAFLRSCPAPWRIRAHKGNNAYMDRRNDLDDTTAERTITNIIREEKPERARERNEAVYGDTDMNPNQDDQRSVHQADEDEIP